MMLRQGLVIVVFVGGMKVIILFRRFSIVFRLLLASLVRGFVVLASIMWHVPWKILNHFFRRIMSPLTGGLAAGIIIILCSLK